MFIINQLQNTTLQVILGGFMAVFAVLYCLLRARVLPNKVMQAWFVHTVLCTVFVSSGILYLTDPLRWIGVPKYYVDRLNVIIMSTAFSLCWYVNPQITMKMTFDDDTKDTPANKRGWKGIPVHGIAIALNHTSFWDIFVFICMAPYAHLIHTRTLMKASLRKIPIFGGVFDRVGHFPVYFKSDEDGNFSVDKDKQAVVQVGVDRHIAEGGNIAIFPEGAVNRHPEVLQTFRFGTFHTIFENKMKTYYMVMVGNERTWPGHSALGGLPADIHIRIGSYPIDFDKEDSRTVATKMQADMQEIYTQILDEEKQGKSPKAVKTLASTEKATAEAERKAVTASS